MTAYRSLVRRAAVTAAVVTAAAVLAACGGEEGSQGHSGHDASSSAAPGKPGAGSHNKADVTFAQGMIPHHRQALEMARLAGTRAGASEVKSLAGRIEKAQGPEIRTMTGWLKSWGEEVPAEGAMDQHTGHSGHSGDEMAGMMSSEEMDRLRESSGEDFDTAFLKMMIEHHRGAVTMAGTEKADGSHGPARKLAGAVVSTQNEEIGLMEDMLGDG